MVEFAVDAFAIREAMKQREAGQERALSQRLKELELNLAAMTGRLRTAMASASIQKTKHAQEVAQYKAALLRQRQRLLHMADAWGKQQAEHSALSAETNEMLRLQQKHVEQTHMANANKIANLESTMIARENAAQTAKSKLREMEGMYTVR